MFKSIITIILTVILIIVIAITSFYYGANFGHRQGTSKAIIYTEQYISGAKLQQNIMLMTFLNKYGKDAIYKESNEMLKNDLDIFFTIYDTEKEDDFEQLFFNEDSKKLKFFLDIYKNLTIVQDYIKQNFTNKEIEQTKIFKRLLEEDFKSK